MNIKVIKTDDSLLQALHAGTHRKITSKNALEQRVSFVYGAMKADSNVTREQVKRAIVELEAISE
jgi:hypothetical protein